MNKPLQSAYQTYKKNQFETASPHKLISLLYGACLQNGTRTQQALANGKLKEAHAAILKMQDILYELIACLNEEQGGEISRNLKNIYLYMIDRLVEANIKKSVEPINEVMKLLSEIKTSWDQIGKEINVRYTSSATSI